jgi:hypothetical protein
VIIASALARAHTHTHTFQMGETPLLLAARLANAEAVREGQRGRGSEREGVVVVMGG